MERRSIITELPSRTKTIKVEIRTWDSLKSLKKENETFNDLIKDLLNEKTKSIGNEDVKAIKYSRRVSFFRGQYGNESVGIEFEYNDVKNQKLDFIFDLKIKKIFYGKRILNPSTFFGVDNAHKHFSPIFLNLYFKGIVVALKKEFRIEFLPYSVIVHDENYENIVLWRQLYYDYNLSEESFKNDIEEPLRLNEEEEPSEEYKKRINESIASSIWRNK